MDFVTFNYDRSLEHFLTKNIAYSCAEDDEPRAFESLSQVNFFHPHGSFGKYPEVPYGLPDLAGLPSQGIMEARQQIEETIRGAAASVRIISDDLSATPEFQGAREALVHAEQIVILGFGFDERTLARLFDGITTASKAVYASVFRLDQSKTSALRSRFGEKLTMGHPNDNAEVFLHKIITE